MTPRISDVPRAAAKRHARFYARFVVVALACLPSSGGAIGAPDIETDAAKKFPARPVRMVIPLAPGGGSDIVGRIVALALTEHWGQSVVVDNRPGAGSTAIAAKAPADGHTLLVSSSSVAISPAFYRDPGFDATRDLPRAI